MEQKRLKKLLDGDLSYFDEFYESTKRQIFYNIYSLLKDETLAEDILQETYIKFLNNLSKMEEDEKSIIGYLMVVSKNLSIDLIRKRKREIEISDYQLENISTEDTYQDNELLEKAKKILKDKEFQILILHVVNELTHKEISKLLKRPLGSITWAYNNAIKKLQKGLISYERE